jgi:hypothetical protein
MSTSSIMGNVIGLGVVSATLSPASVAANTTAEQTFPLPGARLSTDIIMGIAKPTLQAGLGIVNQRISADGVMAITFINATASPIVPTAGEVYKVEWIRTESVQTGISA